MAIENDSPEAQAPVADLKYLFFSSTEWLKSFSENPRRLYGVWNQALRGCPKKS